MCEMPSPDRNGWQEQVVYALFSADIANGGEAKGKREGEEMNIEGIDKAELLAALYNGSHQQVLGCLNPSGKSAMTVEEARAELERTMSFDYLRGRVMKIDISGDTIVTRLYNRDNGDGEAERIVSELREKMGKRPSE